MFSAVKVVMHGLPREVTDASSLEVYKARLDGILSNLVYLKVSIAEGLE